MGAFGDHSTSKDAVQQTDFKQEWLFIIEGSMTVGIAIILLPLLTDYPLQSKHLFLTRDMQLYAVSFSKLVLGYLHKPSIPFS